MGPDQMATFPTKLVVNLLSALDLEGHQPRDQTPRQTRVACLTLVIVVSLLLLPFIDKAFNIDDPLFLWTARQILQTPTDPYAFTVNWYGLDAPMAEVTKNPPLASYYIALVAVALGWSEWVLHLAFLLPALAAVVGTYLVARDFCGHPMVASACGVFTPVFFVSSLTITCDMLMLAFWVFAVYLWVRGLRTNNHAVLALAGLLVALSALSKYFGMTLIPLLFLHAVLTRRRAGWWLIYLVIPIGILAGYQWTTQQLYGRGLVLDAATYASLARAQIIRSPITATWIGLSFTGGCVASLLFFVRQLWSSAAVALGGLCALVIAGVVWSLTTFGTFRLPADDVARGLLALQLGAWGVVGISLVALAGLDLHRRRDSDALFLSLWTLGTFAFAFFINWTTNGRSLLPIVVPAGILIARRLELRARPSQPGALPRAAVPLVAVIILSLAVTWADYRQAETGRVGAARIHATYQASPRPIWFQGHWGFQYYMEQRGAVAVEVNKSRFYPGDLLVTPTTNTNMRAIPAHWGSVSTVLEVPSSAWLATMSRPIGAGFYWDGFGPLPFALGVVATERFTIFRVSN
jgi:4-amino-4-deoxy-L-arabinose transferase-like glycosyltransferase